MGYIDSINNTCGRATSEIIFIIVLPISLLFEIIDRIAKVQNLS